MSEPQGRTWNEVLPLATDRAVKTWKSLLICGSDQADRLRAIQQVIAQLPQNIYAIVIGPESLEVKAPALLMPLTSSDAEGAAAEAKPFFARRSVRTPTSSSSLSRRRRSGRPSSPPPKPDISSSPALQALDPKSSRPFEMPSSRRTGRSYPAKNSKSTSKRSFKARSSWPRMSSFTSSFFPSRPRQSLSPPSKRTPSPSASSTRTPRRSPKGCSALFEISKTSPIALLWADLWRGTRSCRCLEVRRLRNARRVRVLADRCRHWECHAARLPASRR
jgi:hypothetical protein